MGDNSFAVMVAARFVPALIARKPGGFIWLKMDSAIWLRPALATQTNSIILLKVKHVSAVTIYVSIGSELSDSQDRNRRLDFVHP